MGLLGLGEPSRTPSIVQSVHTETTDCNSDISVITSIRLVSFLPMVAFLLVSIMCINNYLFLSQFSCWRSP